MSDIEHELSDAEQRAWEALARYKFLMFGYWCGVWVHFNKAAGFRRPNPWADLVRVAREHLKASLAGDGKPANGREKSVSVGDVS